jgi:hypothetical protein
MNVVAIQGTVEGLTKPKQFKSGVTLSKMQIVPRGSDGSYVEVQVWNDMAKWCGENVKVGNELMVVGQVKRSEWVDKKSGETRHRQLINAQSIIPAWLVPVGVRGGRMYGACDEDDH